MIESLTGWGGILGMVGCFGFLFYFEANIKPIVKSQGFSGFTKNIKALKWSKSNLEELPPAERANAEKAIAAYKYSAYCCLFMFFCYGIAIIANSL